MNTRFEHKQVGFTLPELIVVMSIMSILLGLVTINLTGAKSKADISTSVTTLVADLKQQQLKAMIGDTEGRATPDTYGVHFDQTSYTFFHGASYSSSDPANLVINLEGDMQIAGSPTNIIFSRISGGVVGFNSAANTITLKNISNREQKVIQFNRYGVVTSVN